MNYEDAVSGITRKCAPGSKFGLERIKELLGLLGNPEKGLHCIHITGTNGKGSVSRMLGSILICSGLHVGSFNSPYLMKINEYMSCDGDICSDEEYTELAEKVIKIADSMEDRPTEFELSFAMSILYFASHRCDMAIIEVGLGGEHDATNCIPAPVLAIMTNIGLDHTRILGDSIEAIAKEKSGIIKHGCEVVLYPSDARAIEVIKSRCIAEECCYYMADSKAVKIESRSLDGQYFSYKKTKSLGLTLLGEHQARNAAVVLEAVEVLRGRGYDIEERAIRDGLASVSWPARFEILCRAPLFIADGGHNEQCIRAVVRCIEEYLPNRRFIFIIGVMADKNYDVMFNLLKPYAECVLFVEPDNPRRLESSIGAALWQKLGVTAEAMHKPQEGVRRAFELAQERNCGIMAVGSLYMMGDIRSEVSNVRG